VVRLLRSSRRVPHAGRILESIPRLTALLVRLAVATGLLLLGLATVVLGPWLRVRSVMWTGALQLREGDYARLESMLLGQPLFLLPERALTAALPQSDHVRLRLRRTLPGALTLRLEPRRGVACLSDGTVLDDRGRVLERVPALPGMPRLVGFTCTSDGRGLEPEGRAVLRSVMDVLQDPALAPAVVTWDAAADRLELQLANAGERVLCDAGRAASQLLKLRILTRSLEAEPLPAWMDLRFTDQIVVRKKGGGHGARRGR